MPVSSRLVGRSIEPIEHEIDARWIMAYAAGLGDSLACYVDTRRPNGVVAHPLFPVCVEWPAVLAARAMSDDGQLTAAERARGIHASHDLTIHRLVRSGDRLTTRLTIAGIERRKPGAFEVARLETTDAAGAPVATTWMGSLFLGVDVDGPDRPAVDAPAWPPPIAVAKPVTESRVAIATTAAHVYTECARIWNPIHTDTAYAAAAGLSAPILHGTATLALAVSRVIEAEAGGEPQRVRRIVGRFGAMVWMPSEITVQVLQRRGDAVRFAVRTTEGGAAIGDGLIVLDPGA